MLLKLNVRVIIIISVVRLTGWDMERTSVSVIVRVMARVGTLLLAG